jgi:hypothetical protein
MSKPSQSKTHRRKSQKPPPRSIPIEDLPLFVRPDVVAACIDCSLQHVFNLVEEGKLEAIDVSCGQQKKRYRIIRQSLQNFVARSRSDRAQT